MKKVALFVWKPVIVFLFSLLMSEWTTAKMLVPATGADATTITFHLQRGSRLYISYPLNKVQAKEILLDDVTTDSVFTITVFSPQPFVLFSRNRSVTPYLFYPGLDYSADIKKNETTIDFDCQDKLKAAACNTLRGLEKATQGFELDLAMSPQLRSSLFKSGQYSRSLDSFLIVLKNKRMDILEERRSAGVISGEDYRLLAAYVQYDFIGKRLMPYYRAGFSPDKVPAWYHDTIRQYQTVFKDAALLPMRSFQGALIYYNRFLATAKSGSSPLANQFAAVLDLNLSTPLRDFLYYQVLNNRNNKEDKQYAAYVDSFRLVCSDTLCQSLIRRNFDLLAKEKLLSAGAASLFTMQGKVLDLDSLISKQQQLIYIDCWASWCAPCRREMPSSEKLQKEYKGKNISFLFFSLDVESTAWEKGAADFTFMNPGNSFLVAGNYKSPFVMKHHIGTIPRYILLRSDGTILAADAPRPGDPELKALIDRHL